MVLKTGCAIDRKICVPQRKIMKTVIALEKKDMYFIMKTLLSKKNMSAVLPIGCDGHLR